MGKDKFDILKIIFSVLVVTDALIWGIILFDKGIGFQEIYFLDVGQGDSSLAILPGGANILIDGGPANGLVQANLEKILSFSDRYIDLVIVSHPQIDHFGGLIEVAKNYKIGAVITNGEESDGAAWREFRRILDENKIPVIGLSAGDKIRYRDYLLDILWPEKIGVGGVNGQALAMILSGDRIRSFFGGDLDIGTEKIISEKYNVDVDILKVSHHGSKYSSGEEFLKEASPSFSIIEVGKNSYGHPAKEALKRLGDIGSKIFRTDLSGLIKITINDGKLNIYTQK